MITSAHNEQLKLIRRLRRRRDRDRERLCVAEGEDLVEAALAAGLDPRALLAVPGEMAGALDAAEVEPDLLAGVSELGSGTRVIGVFPTLWAEPGGSVSLYLEGVGDPGNVGTLIRAAHALADGPVILGPGCADPWSGKALRAGMGSTFARPPARVEGVGALQGTIVALDAHAGDPVESLDVRPPVVACLGAEREGLSDEVRARADAIARIPLRDDGPDSVNVALAGAIVLWELGRRMAPDG